MEDFYKTLGISRHSTKEEIRKAYIDILKQYHPDVYQGDKVYAEQVTANTNIAFDFLSNPAKKIKLDEYLKNKEMDQLNRKNSQSTQKTTVQKPNRENIKQRRNIPTDNQIKQQIKDNIKNKSQVDKNKFKLNIMIGIIVITIFILILLLTFII